MYIISKKSLKVFWIKHPSAKEPLTQWYTYVKASTYSNLVEFKQDFPHADLFKQYIIFNIAGNKYRLITSIHFNVKRIYIRFVLTHSDYSKNNWKL